VFLKIGNRNSKDNLQCRILTLYQTRGGGGGSKGFRFYFLVYGSENKNKNREHIKFPAPVNGKIPSVLLSTARVLFGH
jgi:hypothetical protein